MLNNTPFHSPHWPIQTAHQIFWERNNCPFVYEYDPTDDGPEVEIGRAILAMYTTLELIDERIDCCFRGGYAYPEAAL